MSRQLRGAILDAVAEKSLEGLCDGRVPARSATWRDALVKRVPNERVPELVPLFASGGKRLDHERLQRFVDGVEKGFFACVGQRRAEQRKIELAPDHGGDDQRLGSRAPTDG